jgi:hypothetical protein
MDTTTHRRSFPHEQPAVLEQQYRLDPRFPILPGHHQLTSYSDQLRYQVPVERDPRKQWGRDLESGNYELCSYSQVVANQQPSRLPLVDEPSRTVDLGTRRYSGPPSSSSGSPAASTAISRTVSARYKSNLLALGSTQPSSPVHLLSRLQRSQDP